MEQTLSPTCAHVGYTETDEDYHRTVDAEANLELQRGGEGYDLFEQADYVDLNAGRDFLGEDRTYDVVVLHRVFQDRQTSSQAQSSGPLATSQKHTPDAWRARLASTNASVIFAYGGSTEVSGGYLTPIPGYILDVYDAVKAVYLRTATVEKG